ncbi:hypothetical protein [Peribacillus butanolivorans]|uniref:Uncharacterized protein n=1 Tax=Peribacillus butanolivorans TaxID=421767 RepID=A0ABN5N582_9BACI|nr:hypothetical protein [Peribacillus butanolivorans]AXN39875.1 hypothetical protein DTO10_16905 [Peribacillus butanolivorans]
MRRKEKIEVLDFRGFMAGDIRRKETRPKKLTTPIYGFMPSITLSGFMHMSPEIAGLYAVVIGVGAFALLSHLAETTAAAHGYEALASFIETATHLIFPIAAYSFIGWFLFSL